ncbi:MAG: deoxyribonuclease [Chloroflexia bacterium]|jgi:deoxyribonuclease V|nr:deoxyribonuclease [Chloroflexia bacterium]
MPLKPSSLYHKWDVSPEEAVAIQHSLVGKVSLTPDFGEVRHVAGVDMSAKDVARAAVVILSYPELEVLEVQRAEKPLNFPYVPGLLSFREGPAVLAAFDKVKQWPDLVFFDGQGIAHPRKFGIASHMGVLLDLPSIGVGKSPLAIRGPEPPLEPGQWTEWTNRRGEVLAAALRTKLRSNPLYISPGHRIDLPTAVQYVLNSLRGYRLPEPTRQAHNNAAIPEV